MQAREGAQAAVVPAGAQLVVVAAGVLLLVVVGQWGFSRGSEGERSRRINVILFLLLFILRPLIIKKPNKVFSCHLHVRDRDREYD